MIPGWAWVGWLLAFVVMEAYAIIKQGGPNDTLSAYVWRWSRGARWRPWALGAFLIWLFVHLTFGVI